MEEKIGLGINIGSSSVKVVKTVNGEISQSFVAAHEGSFKDSLLKILKKVEGISKAKAIVTGNEGRKLLKINNIQESICIERALQNYPFKVDAVVSLGGENFTTYVLDEQGKVVNNYSGNKCASGTGEFFRQQLGRMDMTLEDTKDIPEDAKVYKLSSRCSVFMKSDCTHKLNKGEATKYDIVLSLSNVMAGKVVDFLNKARLDKGNVALLGGVTRNRYMIKFLREKMKDVNFIVPREAIYYEAWGAALLAQETGSDLPEFSELFNKQEIDYGHVSPLKEAEELVTCIKHRRAKARKGREYILGIDGGSTTTKVALIDYETEEIVASHYTRAHGDPVKSLKECLREVKKQIGNIDINITLAATTGSSREILGMFMQTTGVYNEIIAHSVGTTYFDDEIDTIFEIGGQDAKYVYLKNGVPIDYAMNEACSAGTGSFLEESASGDLNITNVKHIACIASRGKKPLKFGEQCSAFINSDIRKAIQLSASKEDITAGLVTSIVSNYLNRVVGNRAIGQSIALQGGVALNHAIPLAFALLLNKKIMVPPNPELLGCFGVGILAKQKFREKIQKKSTFVIEDILKTRIIYEREFICKACDNYCPIKVMSVDNNKYMFGGRCNKYTNLRRNTQFDEKEIFNYVDVRHQLLFEKHAPEKTMINKTAPTVGIPRALSVYSLYPLYSWFFYELGVNTLLNEEISEFGMNRTESAYCYPAEIAHGAVQNIINMGVDYIFVPHFRDMEPREDEEFSTTCPITQSLPYYVKKAFSEVESQKFLQPIVSFELGPDKAEQEFILVGEKLGFSKPETRRAFRRAYRKQEAFFADLKVTGEKALAAARQSSRPVIALLGRPYNAFTQDANMGIPRKFTSRGYSVIPFDMLPFENAEIFDNMYWYYGIQDMKSTAILKDEDNIFVTYISNFSCAPDSFMLHYVKWMMGTKPFLVLELDSHSADAGIDTRVEAFTDIIEGYREKLNKKSEERFEFTYDFVNEKGKKLHLWDRKNQSRIEIFNNDKVKMLLSNMGDLSTRMIAKSLKEVDINAVPLPIPDIYTLQLARNYMSGKECLPAQLVLGNMLAFLNSENFKKDEIYLLFVPTTHGPCRTGQYYIFYENLFRDLKLDNVVIITLDSDNSYNEFGPTFSKSVWWGLVLADYMKDIETTLRACARDQESALRIYRRQVDRIISSDKKLSESMGLLKDISDILGQIPLERDVSECPKVLIVGEIYVRRDDFAVDELVDRCADNGIIAKVSGVTEWIYYCDHCRKLTNKKKLSIQPWFKKLFASEAVDMLIWGVEQGFKRYVDSRVKYILSKSGLIPESPHNMDKIMDKAYQEFVTDELHSEISISSGAAAAAMKADYSGIINISPFACLIGRVIEGIITPWAKENRFPIISIEIDGNVLPSNLLTQLEIFMLNVKRFRHDFEVEQMIDKI